MARSFEYSVLRVVPDERRGECVNIGIAVFRDEGIDIRITSSLAKVAALNGDVDLDSLRNLPTLINDWTQGITGGARAQQALLTSFGIIAVSELGNFEAETDAIYQQRVAYLMRALVTPVAADTAARTPATKLKTALKAKFRKNHILGAGTLDIAKHLVVPDYPIDEDEGLFADFVLKNGAYRVTETADLRAASVSNLGRVRVASLAAIKLHKAKETFGKSTQTFVVYASRKDPSSHSLNLLGDYSDRVFNLESYKDMATYMELMMEAASHTKHLPQKVHSR
jgi:hypothetical protein